MIRSEMLQRMSAREFYEWMEIEQMEIAAQSPNAAPVNQTPAEMLSVLAKAAGGIKRKKKRG